MSHFEDESFAGRIGTIHPVKGEEEDLALSGESSGWVPSDFLSNNCFWDFLCFWDSRLSHSNTGLP